MGSWKLESGDSPELWDSDGRVLLRLGALLRRDTFLVVLEGGGTVGGLGWCGGVKHLVGLWGPGGLTGLAGLRVDSSERGSALLEDSVLPFRWRSAAEKVSFHPSIHFSCFNSINSVI